MSARALSDRAPCSRLPMIRSSITPSLHGTTNNASSGWSSRTRGSVSMGCNIRIVAATPSTARRDVPAPSPLRYLSCEARSSSQMAAPGTPLGSCAVGSLPSLSITCASRFSAATSVHESASSGSSMPYFTLHSVANACRSPTSTLVPVHTIGCSASSGVKPFSAQIAAYSACQSDRSTGCASQLMSGRLACNRLASASAFANSTESASPSTW
eukprot:scaffold139517_cov27-Tisochrysis_lutea.AAC.1